MYFCFKRIFGLFFHIGTVKNIGRVNYKNGSVKFRELNLHGCFTLQFKSACRLPVLRVNLVDVTPNFTVHERILGKL